QVRPYIWTRLSVERRFNSTGRNSIGSARRSNTTTSLLCAGIALTKASTIYVRPRNHPSVAPRGRARISTKYPSSWKRPWPRNFLSLPAIRARRMLTLPSSGARCIVERSPSRPYFGREPFLSWGKNRFVRPLVQTGRKPSPSLPEVPTIYELMDRYKTPEVGRRLATLVLAPGEFGRPIVAPPGVPAERVKILREALNKTFKDPEFLAETKKREWPVAPVKGEELESLAKEVIAQPPEVVQRLKKLLGE